MILQVQDGRITKVTGDKSHPANAGRLCTKGLTVGGTLDSEDRLMRAAIRPHRSEPAQEVPMGDAIRSVATRLGSIIQEHGPDAVAFYVSGQLSLEAQYLINKLAKGFVGTNNIDSNSRLCMSSAASGYKLSLGADGPPGSYQDFEKADCFLVIGSNMAECHPVLFLRLLDRVRQGAKLIVVDPRRTLTAEKADLYLPIAPGTDLALLNGILHLLNSNGRVDRVFIDGHTDGWEDLVHFLKDYSPEIVAGMTGLAEDDIRQAAKWIGESPEVMSLWTMGLNQSTHGTWHTNALCNLHLAMGKICRPGSGPFSLTGQPNAMGGREVGYLSHGLPGQRTVAKKEDRDFIENLWKLSPGRICPEEGPDAVSMFQKVKDGSIKAIWIMATNPVVSMPKRNGVIEALEKAECVIVQDAYHPTETTRYADILLPGAVWSEAQGTMVNSERTVTLMQKAVEPRGDALPDWEIVARVACEMGFSADFSFQNASEVFDEIRQTTNPSTGYDLRGISYRRLREQSIQWPCAHEAEEGTAIRYREERLQDTPGSTLNSRVLRFPTESGRARFFARPCLPPAELPGKDYPFILTTGRTAHQWHSMTKTGKVAALNKLNSGSFVEIHPEDAARLGFNEGCGVEVASVRGRGIYPARITERILPGCCFVPFHWNDMFGQNLAINAATSEAVDPLSKQPEFKFCAVKLGKTTEVFSLLPATTQTISHELFTEEQQACLRHFFESNRLKIATVRGPIDEKAPFNATQKDWLGHFLADF